MFLMKEGLEAEWLDKAEEIAFLLLSLLQLPQLEYELEQGLVSAFPGTSN